MKPPDGKKPPDDKKSPEDRKADEQKAKRRKLLIGGGVFAVLAAIALVAWLLLKRDPDEPLRLYGNVDIREVDLSFRVEGRVLELYVDEGDVVRAGQIVAKLDASPLQTELAEAEAAVRAQQSNLDLLRAGTRREEIAQADALVAERRAELRDAEADVVRLKPVRDSGAISGKRWEDAVSERNVAAARLRAAREALAEDRAGSRQEDIAQAEGNVQRAQAAADRIRLSVGDTVLRAPSDGTILTRAIEKGANVAAGSAAFTEALGSPVWARIYVEAPNLGLVAPGTLVDLFTDAAPGRSYRGKVGYVSPTAEFTPKTVETPELRTDLVYRARVIVLNPDASLRQGMPITVRLADRRPAVKAPAFQD